MNIYNRKNEMRREVYSKMLKKRQQKSSMRLYDGVVVKEWMEYKGPHHVQKPQAFCKGRIVSELVLTPLRRMLKEN